MSKPNRPTTSCHSVLDEEPSPCFRSISVTRSAGGEPRATRRDGCVGASDHEKEKARNRSATPNRHLKKNCFGWMRPCATGTVATSRFDLVIEMYLSHTRCRTRKTKQLMLKTCLVHPCKMSTGVNVCVQFLGFSFGRFASPGTPINFATRHMTVQRLHVQSFVQHREIERPRILQQTSTSMTWRRTICLKELLHKPTCQCAGQASH